MREEREGNAVFIQKAGDTGAVVEEEPVHYGRPNLNEPTPMAEDSNGPIGTDFFNTEEVEPGKTKVGKTPGGKTVQVYKLGNTTGYGIQFAEGGETPVEFRGKWTTYAKAELDARLWLQKKWDEHASAETQAG